MKKIFVNVKSSHSSNQRARAGVVFKKGFAIQLVDVDKKTLEILKNDKVLVIKESLTDGLTELKGKQISTYTDHTFLFAEKTSNQDTINQDTSNQDTSKQDDNQADVTALPSKEDYENKLKSLQADIIIAAQNHKRNIANEATAKENLKNTIGEENKKKGKAKLDGCVDSTINSGKELNALKQTIKDLKALGYGEGKSWVQKAVDKFT